MQASREAFSISNSSGRPKSMAARSQPDISAGAGSGANIRKTSRSPVAVKGHAGRFLLSYGPESVGSSALTRHGNRIKGTRESLHYLTFPQTYSNGEYHAGSILNIRRSLMGQPGAAVARTPSFLCELYPGLAAPHIQPPSPSDPEETMPSASLVKEFENLIGKENVFTSEADRQSYAYDAAVLPSVVPGLVLRPTSTEQLGALIERCYANGLPMTIRGAGTNLSGGTVPDADKSVVILTQGLNKIIEINEEDLFAIVEPGV
mgnify:CR=1 FL=1